MRYFIISYFIYQFIEITRNTCIKNKREEALICIKVKYFQKFPMMIKLLEVEEQIPIGKCIKLCFHVYRFPVNLFCVFFNLLFRKVLRPSEVLAVGIESSWNLWFTGTQCLTSIAGQWRYSDGSIGWKSFTRTSFSSIETSSLIPSYHSLWYRQLT